MSASCTNCGAALPENARFCPSCGTPTEEGETVRAEVPLNETGEVPVSYQVAEPRFFGVTPPFLLLSVAVVLFVIAIVLFVSGHWPYGLIVLGLAALLVAAFLEAARRRPANGLGHSTAVARERAQSSVETFRARAFAAAEVRRLRRVLMQIETDRRALLHDLGAATHFGDADGEAAIRSRLGELDVHEAHVRAELDAAIAHAGERIRKARLPVQETMMVLPGEPTPPPDEGSPPQPAVVPEPYPPPDEGTPPEPARIPEPGPDPDDR
jgi:zinc-ribbon domain